jgi:hypothetical protein
VDGDKEEVGRISRSVPLKDYRCADYEYERLYDGIWDMGKTYEAEYWFLEAMASRRFLGGIYLDKHGETEESEKAFQDFFEYAMEAQALDAALEEVCEEQGLDLSVMRKFSGTDGELHLRSPEVDQAAVEKYKARLSCAGGFVRANTR